MVEEKDQIVRVGLFSRIDAGSPGYRRGLIEKGFEKFIKEKVHFVVLLGGLVSKRAISHYLKSEVQRLKSNKSKVDKKALEEQYLDSLAKELAEAIPHLAKENGKLPRIYIMTSPSYDGTYGEVVAEKLTRLRSDIRYWSKADEHFPLKRINKKLLGLVPEKEVWRSEYDSTPVDGLVKDHQKRTTKLLPDVYAVGCFASSIYKPRGEARRPYLSVPALHKLEEVKTSENQIGVTIVEVSPETEDFLVKIRTYNLKDIVSRERDFIKLPPHCSTNQVKILNAIKERGALTIGLLEDTTGTSREKLLPTLRRMLNSKKFQPEIRFDKLSGRYDFDTKWIQKNLTYKCSPEEWQEDVLVGFGCLHAGSIHTDYDFFVNRLPKIILESGAKILCGDGDFIEGLEHHLIERGEVMGGLTYTPQEIFAAHLVGEVILKVFEIRFKKDLERVKERLLTNEELKKLILEALLTFYFREGNHDDWVEDKGISPLTTFRYELVNFLKKNISEILKEKGYYLPELDEIIEGKVIKTNLFTLPSGLKTEMFHLHMARAKTTTLRLQELLDKSKAQVVLSANFHVAIAMDRWDPELGQRAAMQFGTIVHRTRFEEGKAKKLDVGVGCLRIFSAKQKIMMTEKIFYIIPPKESFDNREILKELEKKIGIR